MVVVNIKVEGKLEQSMNTKKNAAAKYRLHKKMNTSA
jgi:hypothetical protein